MKKSKIENVKLEQQSITELPLIDTTSCQPFTKPHVIGSFVVPADYDEGPECEDDGCEFCNDIHCDGSCQEDEW